MTYLREDTLVLSLDDVGKEDGIIVGGKGANLGEMRRAGIDVPPGFVVTTKAYRDFMTANGLYGTAEKNLMGIDINESDSLAEAAGKIQQEILLAPIGEEIRNAIEAAYQSLGQGPVATRSSATAEDLAAASFAGQQKTSLNVRGPNEVVQAVRACWASLFEARAIFYREANGFRNEDVSIAVIVQQMVFADVSGVMFTADPNTYDRDMVLIEAIYGLGEPIVSGALSPDSYLVAKSNPQLISRDIVDQPWQLRQRINGHGFDEGTWRENIPPPMRGIQKLMDEHILGLVATGVQLEKVYGGKAQDVEWALEDGHMYIVQTRPITTLRKVAKPSLLDPKNLIPIVSGSPASPGVAAGPVKVIRGPGELRLIKAGDVLVAEMTTPDFVPAMKRASAIVTDHGGRTCHAAIVSREMGVPCVVGTGDATNVLYGLPMVTVDGGTGMVYKGDTAAIFTPSEPDPAISVKIPTSTKLYVNLADPEAAARIADLDVDGVGLLRAEFIMAHIGEHPRAMLESGRGSQFIESLADGLESFAKAFDPRPVVYRFSDFKTNEYRNLRGGEPYEPREENPMLGYRGCSRYLAEPDLFALEVEAIQEVRRRHSNLWAMFPFVRTVEELRGVKNLLKENGLESSQDFKVWMMLEVPSNVLLLDEFLSVGVDGVSIGSNDLTQLVLGVDRDNERLAELFDERNPAVLLALEKVIKGCRERGVTVSICGQAPSVYPEMTRDLVSWGITSISVSPDMIQKTRQIIFEAESA